MFPKSPRKAPGVYTVLIAILAIAMASGAVLGTVLLTRAPGSTLRPRSASGGLLSLTLGKGTEARQGSSNSSVSNGPTATEDGRGLINAVRRFWNNATGGKKTLTMATTNEVADDSDKSAGTPGLGEANTSSGAITPSSGTLLLASAGTAGGGTIVGGTSGSNLTTAAVVDGDYSWTGATSTTWTTATNWSGPNPNTVPGNLDNAVFNSSFTNQPILTRSATVGGLWMTDPVGQNVTIGGVPPHLLSLVGNTINGNADLGILVDNSSGYTLTITCGVKVVNSQTWTNNSANLFTVAGGVNVNGQTLVVSGSGDTLITGVISGGAPSSSLGKSGSGTLTVTGGNTYQGVTVITGGTLFVNGNQSNAHGDVTVTGAGTTLGGTGILGGPVTVNSGANIAPGNGGNTTGILGTGALTLQSGSTFLVDINGTTAGTGFDQLNVAGTVTITGSNLVVTVGTTLSLGQTFLILLNDKSDAVIGQFASGNSVTSGGYIFSIDYAAGDGNDILLGVTAVPEPSTWIGGALAVAALGFTQRRRLVRALKRSSWSRGSFPQPQISDLRVRTRATTLLGLPFLLIFSISGAMSAAELKEARVTQVVQDVHVLKPNASPQPAAVNDNVRQGTAVRTGAESRAELTFTDQTITRLGANTVFSFGAGARAVDLGGGEFLLYVPKNSGGAKIQMGAATAAITGTTVMGEYHPGGLITYIVLEGTSWMYLGNSSAIIHAGQALIFNENATTLPDPQEVDLQLLLQSILITGFPPLPSDAIMAFVALNQHPPLNPPKKDTINPANLVGEVVSPEQ